MHGRKQVEFLSYPYVPKEYLVFWHTLENPDAINLESFSIKFSQIVGKIF
jgi:hypothetical protein